MIYVTKPNLPPISEYYKYLDNIWNSDRITNNGPVLTELETQLKAYLGVEHLQVVSSGTVALQIALAALELKGEVITTAFSHISTTNAIIWNGLKPVFADIEKKTFCIDPLKVESAITEHTSAILATHVFGYPCQVNHIERIAQKHHLKVIYDGAHAFGVKMGDQSIFNFGDISVVSFHATKFYHMVEGGAIVSNNRSISEKCDLLRNFGLEQGLYPVMAGINGKNSDLHAAMGLCNLSKVPGFICKLKELSDLYRYLLKDLPVQLPVRVANVSYNNSYFPVIFSSEEKMLFIKDNLEMAGIFPRRYFYPSLNNLNYTRKSDCPIAESISQRILCLPLYADLTVENVKMIATFMVQLFHDYEQNSISKYTIKKIS